MGYIREKTCDYFCGNCCGNCCGSCSCFKTFRCECDASYCEEYIEKEGKKVSLLSFITFILFLIEVGLYSWTISIYNQHPQSCCGIIMDHNADCNKWDIDESGWFKENPWTISIEHVEDSLLCVIDNVRCDSFTFDNTNTTSTLKECVFRAGYDIDNICSNQELDKYHYDTYFINTFKIYDTIILIYMIWRCVHILFTYFGCLKEGTCNQDRQGYKCSPGSYYCWIDFIVLLLIMLLSSLYVWSYGFEYINEAVQPVNDTAISITDDINELCGTSKIIWTPNISLIPWYLRWYGIRIWTFIIVVIMKFCPQQDSSQEDAVSELKNNPNLIKAKYPKQEEEIELQTKITVKLSDCTSMDETQGNIIKNCDYLQRISKVIQNYEEIRNLNHLDIDEATRNHFIELCSDNYGDGDGHNLLDDIYHFQSHHQHQHSNIANEMELKSCELLDINNCSSSIRHYDGSRCEKQAVNSTEYTKDNDEKYKFYLSIMDNVHVLLFHLQELGLRFDVNNSTTVLEEYDNKYGDEDHKMIDEEFGKIRDIIFSRSRDYGKRINRFSSVNNTKYTLSQQVTSLMLAANEEYWHKNGGLFIPTWVDQLLNTITIDSAVNQMYGIIIDNEYDTDSLCQDTEDKIQSNIYKQISNEEIFSIITHTIKTSQCMLFL